MFKSRVMAAVAAICMLGAGGAAAQESVGDVISEVKVGVIGHDVFRENAGKDAEEGSVDINGEILFTRIGLIDTGDELLNLLVQPRPHLGGYVNTEGYTNQFYFGLTWDYQFAAGPFIEFAFGFTVHDGKLERTSPSHDRPNLGSPVLFREGLDIGYRFDSGHSLAVHGAHISNGGVFAKENDGMDFLGLRYGYRFN